MENFVKKTYKKNVKKMELILREKAIKNVENECILRNVEFESIPLDKLEILIRNEEDKIKSKFKTSSIALPLIALGLHA